MELQKNIGKTMNTCTFGKQTKFKRAYYPTTKPVKNTYSMKNTIITGPNASGKTTFIKSGMFNENYKNCFEDVELNVQLLSMGYQNIYDGTLVAYHYESQTRNENEDNLKTLMLDYQNTLFPFLKKNFEYIKKYTLVLS